MVKGTRTGSQTQSGKDSQEESRPAQDHGGVSFPGVTSLGEDGGPTMIGEGRVDPHITEDDEWFAAFHKK